MIDKTVRLLKALSNESVKRLPYIFLLLIILVFVQFLKLNSQTARSVQIAKNNSIDSKSLLKQVAQLSRDNKALSEQNNRIAKENAAHLDCVAQLFAQYTRDLTPVLTVDLNTCFIQEAAQSGEKVAQPFVQPSLLNSSVPSSSSNGTPKKHIPLSKSLLNRICSKLKICK